MELMNLVAERVKILFASAWRENQVEIAEDDRYLPETTEEMKAAAEARFASRRAKNPKLFDGDAFHLDLLHSIIQPDLVVFTVSKMKYSLYDIARKEYVEKYGWKTIPTGMGMNAVIVTSDSKIIMHDRFPQTDHALKISIIGGVYDGGHPFDYIRKEIQKELGINREELKKILLIGLSNRLDERINHELTFFIKTSVSSNQILKREGSAEEKEGKIFFVDQDPISFKEYLKRNHHLILSSGFSALVLAGRYFWGTDWPRDDLT